MKQNVGKAVKIAVLTVGAFVMIFLAVSTVRRN